jgi:ribosomal protein L37AE/L43A
MINGKKEIEWNKNTKKMKRRDQVVISRLGTGYTMTTHVYIINKQDNFNECPFCNVRLTVYRILWDCKETGGFFVLVFHSNLRIV